MPDDESFRPGIDGENAPQQDTQNGQIATPVQRTALSWASIAEPEQPIDAAPNTPDEQSEENSIEPAVAKVTQPEVDATPTPSESQNQPDVDSKDDRPSSASSAEAVSTPKATITPIDDSAIPDPGPALLQNLKPETVEPSKSRLRRGRRRMASSANARMPATLEKPTLEVEKLSGRFAEGPPPRQKRQSDRHRPRLDETDESDRVINYRATDTETTADEQQDSRESRNKPRNRRRGGRDRKAAATTAAVENEAQQKALAVSWDQPKSRKESVLEKIVAFFRKLLGGEKTPSPVDTAPATTARKQAGTNRNRKPGPKPEPKRNEAETPNGGAPKRRRGKRGGRRRNKPKSDSTAGQES